MVIIFECWKEGKSSVCVKDEPLVTWNVEGSHSKSICHSVFFFKMLQFMYIDDLTQNYRHCKLTGLALHTDSCPWEWDASQRGWMGWCSHAGLCFGLSLLVTQLLQWDAWRQKVFLVERSLKILIPIKMEQEVNGGKMYRISWIFLKFWAKNKS